MRLIKMIGLAAIAAVAAMAFLGAGTASASKTELCAETAPTGAPLACAAETVLKTASITGTSEGSISKVGVLKTSLGKIECEPNEFGASLERKVVGTEVLLEGKTTTLSFGLEGGKKGCKTTIPTCEVKEVKAAVPFATKVLYTGTTEPQGSVVLTKPATTVILLCLGFIKETCVFANNAGETVTASLFNKEQEIRATNAKVKLTSGGSNCPTEGEETVSYKAKLASGESTTGKKFTNKAVFVAEK